MNADLLREFHPDTHTGLYDAAYADVITRYGDTTMIEDWAASVANLPPTPPEDEDVQPWVQPIPGDESQWFNRGYPFGHKVLHTINGTEYTMRSNRDGNVWEPSFDARFWQTDPVISVPWKSGQVWDTGGCREPSRR